LVRARGRFLRAHESHPFFAAPRPAPAFPASSCIRSCTSQKRAAVPVALLGSPVLCAALVLAPLLTAPQALAQNATWLNAPVSGDFSDANNWNPASVPTGTAFFGTSSVTALMSPVNSQDCLRRTRNNGMLGRSNGCTTIDPVENNKIITRLMGALIYVTVGDDPIEQYL
jgi:hypothetical protein